jgi:hypothetical protein
VDDERGQEQEARDQQGGEVGQHSEHHGSPLTMITTPVRGTVTAGAGAPAWRA